MLNQMLAKTLIAVMLLTVFFQITASAQQQRQPKVNPKIVNPKIVNPVQVPLGDAVIRPEYLRQVPTANKSASLIYFNFGENSEYTALFQDTVKLKKAMEGYQMKVLLKAETTPNWLDFSEADERQADIKAPPTKANFFKYIKELTADGYYIDLYIFAHGWTGKFGPKNDSNNQITIADITASLSPDATGFTKIPIRIVWGTNCYGQTLGETWRSVGAKTTAGAQFVNFYPNGFSNFIDDWNKGNVNFDSAVVNADTNFIRTAAQVYIQADATATRNQWGGCPLFQTVLGNHDCAKDYFMDSWLDPAEWDNSKSGKDNMNKSSFMFRGGEKTLTKNSRPRW